MSTCCSFPLQHRTGTVWSGFGLGLALSDRAFAIRCPGDVGEVAVFWVAHVQVDGLLSSRIVDTYLYLMAEHAGLG